MFGIGLPELIIIIIVALLVVGPSKLPDLAKSLGKALGEFRRMADEVKETIEEEMVKEEPKDETKKEAEAPKGTDEAAAPPVTEETKAEAETAYAAPQPEQAQEPEKQAAQGTPTDDPKRT